jgi:hypothetical protein
MSFACLKLSDAVPRLDRGPRSSFTTALPSQPPSRQATSPTRSPVQPSSSTNVTAPRASCPSHSSQHRRHHRAACSIPAPSKPPVLPLAHQLHSPALTPQAPAATRGCAKSNGGPTTPARNIDSMCATRYKTGRPQHPVTSVQSTGYQDPGSESIIKPPPPSRDRRIL